MSKCPIMTVEAIKVHHPCKDQFRVFLKHWPNGMPLTRENWDKLLTLEVDGEPFDWRWFIRLLSEPARVEYEKVEQSAWDEYEKVDQAERDEYWEARQLAWDKYWEIVSAALLSGLRQAFGGDNNDKDGAYLIHDWELHKPFVYYD